MDDLKEIFINVFVITISLALLFGVIWLAVETL